MSEQRSINPAKRRRISFHHRDYPDAHDSSLSADSNDKPDSPDQENRKDQNQNENTHISIFSSSKLLGQTVAPFLSEHIPEQYAPLGGPNHSATKDPNTKYCYRHRPDLKCRRQANEPSMDELQKGLQKLSQNDQRAIAHVWALFSAAPSMHRNLMLQGILTQCCFPQLSYLSGRVEELLRIDFLSALPTELAFKILCYLDTTSLCKATQVSQRWRSLADDDVVWHKMCQQHIDRKCKKCGWGLPLLERTRLRASKREIQLRGTGRGLNEWSPDITPAPESSSQEFSRAHVPSLEDFDRDTTAADSSRDRRYPLASQSLNLPHKIPRLRPWKDVYKDRFKVGLNWRHGRYSIKIFQGHLNGVMCLQFDDRILASGSYDTTIKIWDLESAKEIRTLRGHTSGIRCLQFDDTKLISGSLDHTLKIWDWRTGNCLRTYTGHADGVICLHFDSKLLVSGSIDKTVRVWNFEDKSTSVLRGHDDWVNSVKIDKGSRTLFSASDDLTVRLWDLDTNTTLRIFKGHVGQVQQVLPLPHDFELTADDGATESDEHDDSSSRNGLPNGIVTPPPSTNGFYGSGFADMTRRLPPRYMLTGALDSTIRLWDVATGKCLRTFFGHVEGVWDLAADSLRMVSGSEDRTLKIWDPRTGDCEGTFTGHTGPVTCVGLSDSRIATGSEDSEVRMYSFKSDDGSFGTGRPEVSEATMVH